VSSGHSPDWLKSKNPAAPAAKREAGATVVDEIGEDFPTLQQAEAHAAIIAKELGRNDPQPVTVFVFSQEGIQLASTAPENE
jgi:hypothetical protein